MGTDCRPRERRLVPRHPTHLLSLLLLVAVFCQSEARSHRGGRSVSSQESSESENSMVMDEEETQEEEEAQEQQEEVEEILNELADEIQDRQNLNDQERAALLEDLQAAVAAFLASLTTTTA